MSAVWNLKRTYNHQVNVECRQDDNNSQLCLRVFLHAVYVECQVRADEKQMLIYSRRGKTE